MPKPPHYCLDDMGQCDDVMVCHVTSCEVAAVAVVLRPSCASQIWCHVTFCSQPIGAWVASVAAFRAGHWYRSKVVPGRTAVNREGVRCDGVIWACPLHHAPRTFPRQLRGEGGTLEFRLAPRDSAARKVDNWGVSRFAPRPPVKDPLVTNLVETCTWDRGQGEGGEARCCDGVTGDGGKRAVVKVGAEPVVAKKTKGRSLTGSLGGGVPVAWVVPSCTLPLACAVEPRPM